MTKPTCFFNLKNDSLSGFRIILEPLAFEFVLPALKTVEIHLFGLNPVGMEFWQPSAKNSMAGISLWPHHGDYEIFYENMWKHDLIGLKSWDSRKVAEDLQNTLGSPTVNRMSLSELYGDGSNSDMPTCMFKIENSGHKKMHLINGQEATVQILGVACEASVQLFGFEKPISMSYSFDKDGVSCISFFPDKGRYTVNCQPKEAKG
jgi:hypothetical protein